MSTPTLDRMLSRIMHDSPLSLVRAIGAELEGVRNTSSATAHIADVLRDNAQKLADAVTSPHEWITTLAPTPDINAAAEGAEAVVAPVVKRRRVNRT